MSIVQVMAMSAAAAVGLAMGSFLAAAAYRLPRSMPIVAARSQCPHCGHRLGARELIPILSWLLQRRRCLSCGRIVPVYYAAVELMAALIAVLAIYFAPGIVGAAFCVAGWSLLSILAWLWSRPAGRIGL